MNNCLFNISVLLNCGVSLRKEENIVMVCFCVRVGFFLIQPLSLRLGSISQASVLRYTTPPPPHCSWRFRLEPNGRNTKNTRICGPGECHIKSQFFTGLHFYGTAFCPPNQKKNLSFTRQTRPVVRCSDQLPSECSSLKKVHLHYISYIYHHTIIIIIIYHTYYIYIYTYI